MIELHRLSQDDDTRVSIEADEIKQIHVGKGGVTIVSTSVGKIPVTESYEDVVAMKEEAE